MPYSNGNQVGPALAPRRRPAPASWACAATTQRAGARRGHGWRRHLRGGPEPHPAPARRPAAGLVLLRRPWRTTPACPPCSPRCPLAPGAWPPWTWALDRVIVVGRDMGLVGRWPVAAAAGDAAPGDLALGDDRVFLADSAHGRVLVRGLDGRNLGAWPTHEGARGIAVGPHGRRVHDRPGRLGLPLHRRRRIAHRLAHARRQRRGAGHRGGTGRPSVRAVAGAGRSGRCR